LSAEQGKHIQDVSECKGATSAKTVEAKLGLRGYFILSFAAVMALPSLFGRYLWRSI